MEIGAGAGAAGRDLLFRVLEEMPENAWAKDGSDGMAVMGVTAGAGGRSCAGSDIERACVVCSLCVCNYVLKSQDVAEEVTVWRVEIVADVVACVVGVAVGSVGAVCRGGRMSVGVGEKKR